MLAKSRYFGSGSGAAFTCRSDRLQPAFLAGHVDNQRLYQHHESGLSKRATFCSRISTGSLPIYLIHQYYHPALPSLSGPDPTEPRWVHAMHIAESFVHVGWGNGRRRGTHRIPRHNHIAPAGPGVLDSVRAASNGPGNQMHSSWTRETVTFSKRS